MKQFIIREEQAKSLLSILLEVPAKFSLPGIDILRSLPSHEAEVGLPEVTKGK